MNMLQRLIAAFVPALALVACGQTAAPAKVTYTPASFAASSDTQTKTAVKLWKFQGAQTGLTVMGSDSSDKVYHVLTVTGEDANTFKISQGYKNAAGELLASVSVLTHNDGTYSISKTGDPTDPALCPNCMGNDFVAANPNSSGTAQTQFTGTINPVPPVILDPSDPVAVSTACDIALKHLARAAMNVARQCSGHPTGGGSILGDACTTATIAYQFTYS